MEFKDYYKVLGVSRDAKDDDIKRAYRKLARKYHPDVSKEPNAEEQFKTVQEAYEVLKDPKKREAYNQLGSNWKSGQEFRPPPDWQGFSGFDTSGFNTEDMGGHGFSDFFEAIFGQHQSGSFRGAKRAHHARSMRGQDEVAKINITLEEAYLGGQKTIQIQMPEIDAHGQLIANKRTLKIQIPKGVISGQQLRLSKQGSKGLNGGEAGDLYLEINVEPHKRFTLQGHDIYITLPITPWEAALGRTIPVATLGGSVDMKIPPGAQAGQKLRLKGRGMPYDNTSGDQYVLLQILTPPAKTTADRELYEKMAELMPFNPRTDS